MFRSSRFPGVWARSGRPSEFGENISSRAWKGRAEGSSTRHLASFFCGVRIFIEVCFRLCIQVPFAGGYVFEKGDEEPKVSCHVIHPFGKHFNYWIAPIVVVFTQFDKLLDRKEMDLTTTDVNNKSDEEIKKRLKHWHLSFSKQMMTSNGLASISSLGSNLPYEKVSGLVLFLTRVRFHWCYVSRAWSWSIGIIVGRGTDSRKVIS